MTTDTNVQNLIINKLTQSQYESIANPNDTELYLTPDESVISETVENIWTGTKAQYDAIVTKDSNTLYWLTDAKVIYLGNTPVGNFSGNREIGEIVTSTIPLTDASLHLLDGALIDGSGIYSAFVDHIAELYGDGTNVPSYFTDETTWQSSVTNYGVCGKFVYDSTNNTVRLPKYSDKIYTGGGTAPVVGNGMTLGLSNGTTNYGLSANNNTSYPYLYGSSGSYGSSVGITKAGTYNSVNLTYGVTTDPTKSGLIANLSDITTSLDGYYYIVLATTAKTDIEVDIDEIATDLNGKADVDLTNINNSCKALDGQWVNSYLYLISSATTIEGQSTRTFDLSSYLPNDGYDYEVMVSVIGRTSATSGTALGLYFSSDLITYKYSIVGTYAITRTSSYMADATTSIVPIGTGRTLSMFCSQSSSVSVVATELWVSSYRRIGTNQ